MPRLLSALAIALALVACGESAEDEYRDAFGSLNRQLVALGDRVREGVRSAGDSDDSALAREFGGYARRLEQLRLRLDELEAPELDRAGPRAAAHRDSGRPRRAGRVADAAQRGDAAAARAAAIDLVRGSERLSEARRKLAAATARSG